METRIVGVFDSQQEVINEIKKYESEGVDRDNFSVLAKDDTDTEYLTENMDVDEMRPANEGAFGFFGGFFAGIGGGVAVPGMTHPGTGPLIAAGPIASMFTGKNHQDLKNMFDTMGVDSTEYDNYIEELDAGKILLFLD